MTDQFADSPEPLPGRDDEGRVDAAEDDQLDEGYAPPAPWPGSDEDDSDDAERVDAPLEQRLEQEDADVEDDWDED